MMVFVDCVSVKIQMFVKRSEVAEHDRVEHLNLFALFLHELLL